MYHLTLDKDDFLRFHLFTAAKSKRIKAQRIRSWIAITVALLCLAGMFALGNDPDFALSLLIVAGLCFIFLPFYFKWRYKKYFGKHVADHYKNRMGVPCELGFEDGYLHSKDNSGEGKVKLAEIEVINEIGENLFVKMKGGFTFIFPKKMQNFEFFKNELQGLIKDLNIEWKVELNWKW